MDSITKTCRYYFDPLKPHFYTLKLEFTGLYIFFFFFLLKNINCEYSLEPPWRGSSNENHNLCFEVKYEKKMQKFISDNFHFLCVNFQKI